MNSIAPARFLKVVVVCLAVILPSAFAAAQDLRLGVSGSLSRVVSLDATWLPLEVPSPDGPVRFGVRADVAARLAALGVPSVAASLVVDAGPDEGVAAHVGGGVVLMRSTGPAQDFVPSPYLLAGLEWPLNQYLRVRIEGSLVPGANAAGVGFGLVVLPFGVQ